MTFRKSAPALLIAASLAAILGVTGVAYRLTNGLLENAEEGSYKLMRDVLASILKSTEDRALVRAELVASMPSVRAAFLARDRPKLLAETQAMFGVQVEKYGLDQAQFHLAPGVSFLRLHNPAKFGDDQRAYRPMLSDVHQSRALRKGVAVTRSGPAIAGIVPIADDEGKHFGSFEMGLEFAPMLDKIKASYGLEVAVYIDEKMLRDISTDLGGEVVTPKNRVGKYIRFHATHPDLMAALVADDDVEVAEPKSYSRRAAGAPWGVQLVPMYNYANHQIGVYALAKDFSETRATEGRSRVWQLLAALCGVVFMSGAVLVVVRGVLLRPLRVLTDRLAALADGDEAPPAGPADGYCEELRSLVASYERLRSRRGP
ncbi:MAG TPA: cache domain-containing protein [Polyangiaceae bacterium]|nr:cache domain-containing protein [Polyangiaceae bacterium]